MKKINAKPYFESILFIFIFFTPLASSEELTINMDLSLDLIVIPTISCRFI